MLAPSTRIVLKWTRSANRRAVRCASCGAAGDAEQGDMSFRWLSYEAANGAGSCEKDMGQEYGVTATGDGNATGLGSQVFFVDVEVLPALGALPALSGQFPVLPAQSSQLATQHEMLMLSMAGTWAGTTGLGLADPGLGLVSLASPPGDDTTEPFTDILPSKSPRRTAVLEFTCRRCGTRTRAKVNPHAMRHGTVFARCSNEASCGVTHKIVDNLRLFHELAGPVFWPETPFWPTAPFPFGPLLTTPQRNVPE